MIPYSFMNLEPITWRQTLHTKRGAGFSVSARIAENYDFIISEVGNVGGMRTDLMFVRGAYDWQIPEGPSGSLGFLAYHPADQHSDVSFIGGGCSIKEDIYDDAWHRVRSSAYDACTISLEVAPIDYDGEDPMWDRQKNEFLYIREVELAFIRKEKPKEGPSTKRGLFG